MNKEMGEAPSKRAKSCAFFVAFLAGLVALSLAGRFVSSINIFDHFERFHIFLTPATLFAPTASEVTALARDSARPDQALVIIGGSSILQGAGQGKEEVWTRYLADRLGDRFGVVNLAFPSGLPGEHGSIAAQALIKEGRQLVFVTLVFPGRSDADGGTYRYVVWDALARDMLLPSRERDTLLSSPSDFGPGIDELRQELRFRSLVGAVTNAADLWQAIGYELVYSAWTPYATPGEPFWAPRRLMVDPEPAIKVREYRYQPQHDEATMAALNVEVASRCAEHDGVWTVAEDGQAWARYRTTLAAQIPPGLREHAIVMVLHKSPYFTSRLPATARACLREQYQRAADLLTDEGYHVVQLGQDWDADDFTDLLHPSGAGGQKMAATLAPHIQSLAARSEQP
jgi:lysophospholipase L1-like esterase